MIALSVTGLAGCLGDAPVVPVDSLTWSTGPAAPEPRTEVAVAAIGTTIYVVGGLAPSGATNRVDALDVTSGTWRQVADYPLPVHHTAVVAHDGHLLAFGGYPHSSFQASVGAFAYDPEEDTWTPLTPMPTARGAHGAAVVDGRVYLVGGVGADGDLLAEVDVYDIGAGTWSRGPALPAPREHLGVTVHDGAVYAVAGRQGSLTTNMGTTSVLDGDEWRRLARAPTPRGGVAVASFLDHVVLIGGEQRHGTFGEVEAYDPADNKWTTWPSLPTPRHGLGAVVVGDALYSVMGGPEAGFSYSAVVEVLRQDG